MDVKHWTDQDIEKMKQGYLSGSYEATCPLCNGKVKITKEAG